MYAQVQKDVGLTCGRRLTLGAQDVIVLPVRTHAQEGAFHVDALGFATHAAQQLALVGVCGETGAPAAVIKRAQSGPHGAGSARCSSRKNTLM